MITTSYKTSKDYKRLKELLDKGYDVICIADYLWNGTPVSRDICHAFRSNDTYRFIARGIEYNSYWPDMAHYESFEDACEVSNIEFIEPTEEEL